VVVEMHRPETPNLFSRHVRAVDSFFQRWWKYCHVLSTDGIAWFFNLLRVVHMRKKPRYRLCSNSAMMQSTMCGLGVSMYMASMSLCVVLRSSRRSMSGEVRSVPGVVNGVAYL
jgi:hypothetical protein